MKRHLNSLHLLTLVLPAVLVLSLASCGREAPTYAPGSISVTSTPEGAAVFLDGRDTGLVTPATLTDLETGLYLVSVQLEDWESDPESLSLELAPLEILQADFTLSRTGIRVAGPEGARILVDGAEVLVGTTARLGLKVGDDGKLFATGGYNFTLTDDGGDAWHLGAGYHHKLGDSLYLGAEYRHYFDDFVDADALNAVVGLTF